MLPTLHRRISAASRWHGRPQVAILPREQGCILLSAANLFMYVHVLDVMLEEPTSMDYEVLVMLGELKGSNARAVSSSKSPRSDIHQAK